MNTFTQIDSKFLIPLSYTQYNCTLYCMVTYTAGDNAPELSSDCTYPTTSTHELIQSFENLEWVSY